MIFLKLGQLKYERIQIGIIVIIHVIFDSEEILLKVQAALNKESIIPRRYFYPSLNTIPYLNGEQMPISESIASKILCLPLYVGLTQEELNKITSIINSTC